MSTLAACYSKTVVHEEATLSKPNTKETINQAALIDIVASELGHHDKQGTFVLTSLESQNSYIYNSERANQRFSPASTFKIINTLIGLDLGVVQSIDSPFEWDGTKRSIPSWNRDQTLESAFKLSCVWCYQKIAREVGIERYSLALDKMNYGNKQISNQVDMFWLNGDLAITAVEQTQLLKKILSYSLALKPEHIDILKSVMLVEDKPEYKIYAKTGWTGPKLGVGWYVGFIEKEDNTWLFAFNIEMDKAQEGNLRKKIAMKALKASNLL